MRRLQKFLALTAAGQRIVLRCLLLLPMVAMLLRMRGMARTAALLDSPRPRAGRDPEPLAPHDIARLVHAAASVLGTACLPQSMVLRHLLRAHGMASEIRLGVSKLADGNLSAHAWVEIDGVPLNDSADVLARYASLPSSASKIQVDLL